MKIGDRVVITKGQYKKSVGTIVYYDFRDTLKLEVLLDKEQEEIIHCDCDDVVVIDDITDIGNIKFKVGMKIYDKPLNMVGEIVQIMEDKDDLDDYKVVFENGDVKYLPLVEKINYIVAE